jgi:hypothetical protein
MQLLDAQARPSDLRYFFDFLSPILEAFFFTVSDDRPNLAATFTVGLFGKSFLSRLTSPLDHKPLISFFFAIHPILFVDCREFPAIITVEVIVSKDFCFVWRKMSPENQGVF